MTGSRHLSDAPVGSERPIRVAVINDYELVVRGLGALLEPYADRIHVVELNTNTEPTTPVDVALYDAFSMEGVQGEAIDEIIADADVQKLAIYTWSMHADVVAEALRRGVAGMLSKTLGAADLVEAIERIHAGDVVVDAGAGELPQPLPAEHPPADAGANDAGSESGASWPGKSEGLTAREAEVVALIVQGLSNKEVASRTYLSINSVKSYIRSAYRTMGVHSRSQAVLWGLDHGMRPDIRRIDVGNGQDSAPRS